MDGVWASGRTVREATREVFTWPYLLLAVVIAAAVFVLAVWLPNLDLLMNVITSPDVALVLKWQLAVSLLGSIGTNFTLPTAVSTIVSTLLFGIDAAMLTYYFKQQRRLVSQGTMLTGVGGLVTGVFGISCAACGSLLFTSILVFFGASSLLLWLPLKGAEFSLLGAALLAVTLVLVSRAITEAAVCRISSNGNSKTVYAK